MSEEYEKTKFFDEWHERREQYFKDLTVVVILLLAFGMIWILPALVLFLLS